MTLKHGRFSHWSQHVTGCAMIAKPSVVILDEPTTGLDPVSRRGIWETIAGVIPARCLSDVCFLHLTCFQVGT